MSSNTTNTTSTSKPPTVAGVGTIFAINVIALGIMIGGMVLMYKEPNFKPEDEICILVIVGTTLAVLTILSLVGFGFLVESTRNNIDQDTKTKKLNTAYGYEGAVLALSVLIVLIASCYVCCCKSETTSASSPLGIFLFLNGIGECIGPCCQCIGACLGSLK